MKPRTEVVIGQLPPFWNRGVLFFCNIHSIFYDNREEARQLIEEITGARSYGGRVIPILNLLFHGRPNLILLEATPNSALLAYLTDTLALSLPDYEILNHRGYRSLASRRGGEKSSLVKRLEEHPAEWLDGFVTDANLVKIAARLGKRTITTLEGSKNGNNKYLLHQHQVEQHLPVFDTVIAARRGDISECLKGLRRMGYKSAVVKAQIGASGYGMLKLPAEESQAASVPDFLFFEGPCMVQGWIEDGVLGARKIASPSVQLFLDEDTVYLFDMTEQILSEESVHQGNMSPPPLAEKHPDVPEELLRQAAIAGKWLHAQGYRGTASADFLVIERREALESILCEINARVTGATYPSLLARHFKPQGSWLMRNIRFSKPLDGGELLALMDRAGVLYRPGAPKGMIPFNFNTDDDGRIMKGQFACIGDNYDDCNTLVVQAWSQLPVDWRYDRD